MADVGMVRWMRMVDNRRIWRQRVQASQKSEMVQAEVAEAIRFKTSVGRVARREVMGSQLGYLDYLGYNHIHILSTESTQRQHKPAFPESRLLPHGHRRLRHRCPRRKTRRRLCCRSVPARIRRSALHMLRDGGHGRCFTCRATPG